MDRSENSTTGYRPASRRPIQREVTKTGHAESTEADTAEFLLFHRENYDFPTSVMGNLSPKRYRTDIKDTATEISSEQICLTDEKDGFSFSVAPDPGAEIASLLKRSGREWLQLMDRAEDLAPSDRWRGIESPAPGSFSWHIPCFFRSRFRVEPDGAIRRNRENELQCHNSHTQHVIMRARWWRGNSTRPTSKMRSAHC